jgi:hypothetical protein
MKNRVTLLLILGCFCLVSYACSGTTPEATKPGANSNAPATPAPAAPAAPLAALSAYGVEWISNQIPSEMQAGRSYTVTLTIKNPTSATWPAGGTARPGSVDVAYHWLPAQGDKPVVFEGERTGLPHDIAPGESITLSNVLVVAPPSPGSYRLQMTLVHESITWFDVKPLTLPVTVR